MPRPKFYKNGTVTRSLTISADADKALEGYAKKRKITRSQAASMLILVNWGRTPALAKKVSPV